jgi:arabinan endo-1,5-alpha-L-arabinosidase
MSRVAVLLLACCMAGCGEGSLGPSATTQLLPAAAPTSTPPAVAGTPTAQALCAGCYVNPIQIAIPGGGTMPSCPDPSILRGQTPGDSAWYIYCTNELFSDGSPLHLMAISKSTDLVNWTYVGDVFSSVPSWAAAGGGLWAPDIEYFNGKYYLYYAVSAVAGNGGSAIYVATSDSPAGPWNANPTAVVEPCCSDYARSTIDPAIVQDDSGHRYIFFGSYKGGIFARELSNDGMNSSANTEVQIAESDRYEGAYVVKRNGYYYLFVSSSDCCRGPLTGYAVFAGRSTNVLGPYVDADGVSLLDARVGGTPALTMNGNRWVGPGHIAVFTDAAGQDWMLYHAVDSNQPYFSNGWTRRPVLMDAIDWVDGWPRVRNGAGPSDSPQPGPVTVASANQHVAGSDLFDSLGAAIDALSDDFSTQSLSAQWRWIRPPSSQSYAVSNGVLRFDTQPGTVYVGEATASILTEPAPTNGDYMVEVKLATTLPISGSHDFVQGGFLIYADDNNYVKLVDVAIANTRQIEFGKQTSNEPAGYPQYGSTLLSSPSDNTYLRIAKHSSGSGETYTAYASHDGTHWTRGGTWTHQLGSNAKIGLVSMNGSGYSTLFDYVRVYSFGQ